MDEIGPRPNELLVMTLSNGRFRNSVHIKPQVRLAGEPSSVGVKLNGKYSRYYPVWQPYQPETRQELLLPAFKTGALITENYTNRINKI